MTELEEAADPKTSPARLAALAESLLPEVQRAVAVNPTATLATLLKLGKRWPQLTASNLAWPLLLLENPAALVGRYKHLQAAVASGPLGAALLSSDSLIQLHAKVLLLNPVLNQAQRRDLLGCIHFHAAQEILSGLAPGLAASLFGEAWLRQLRRGGLGRDGSLHPATGTSAQLEQLARGSLLGSTLALRSPRCPAAFIIQEAERSHPWGPDFWGEFTEQDRWPIEVLDRLLSCGAANARALLAEYPWLPANHQRALAADSSPLVRERLATNPRLTPALMPLLVRDPAEGVRGLLARRSDLSLPLRRQLALAEATKLYLAESAALPVELLRQLAHDADEGIRRRIADKRRLPVDVLRLLAGDSSTTVQYGLGRQHGPKLLALGLLHAGSPSQLLKGAAVRTPAAIEWLAGHPDEELRAAAVFHACNVRSGMDDLNQIGWARIAPRRPCVRADWFRRLAMDPSVRVRDAMATCSWALAPDLLALLASDSSEQVRSTLASWAVDQSVLLRLASDPSEQVRAALLSPRNGVDLSLLDRLLCDDPCAEVRGAVARRTSDAELLRTLASDPDPSVRTLALQHQDRLGLGLQGEVPLR